MRHLFLEIQKQIRNIFSTQKQKKRSKNPSYKLHPLPSTGLQLSDTPRKKKRKKKATNQLFSQGNFSTSPLASAASSAAADMDTTIGSVPTASDAAAPPPAPAAATAPREATLGRHLARRLAEVGARDVFTVPGDFNLTLLDELEAEAGHGGVRLVGCCNELNAAYAADGYARARGGGVGACAVTFTVGGLSAINAVAGAFSENLPVVCIVGGPNSNDYGSNRILHHTIGLPDFTQELRCFQTVTCYQVIPIFRFQS